MSVRLTSRIPKLVAEAEAKAAAAVQKTGLDIEAGAKLHVPPRVDTGFMRDSIQWTSDDPLEGEVIAGAEHTIYNEFGTVSMAAHPMLTPAAEEARGDFERAMASVYR